MLSEDYKAPISTMGINRYAKYIKLQNKIF